MEWGRWMIICRYWLLWNVAASIKPNRHVLDAITHINKIAQLVEVEAFLAFLFDIYANCLNISCGWNCHRIACVLVTCGKRKRTALHKYIHVSVHKSCLKYRFKVIWCVHAVAMPFAHNTITPRARNHSFFWWKTLRIHQTDSIWTIWCASTLSECIFCVFLATLQTL